MGRELFIVSRDRAHLFRYLTQTFAGAENVDVIWDRRVAERRHRSMPVTSDRRRADRRTRPGIDNDLKQVGYAFLAE